MPIHAQNLNELLELRHLKKAGHLSNKIQPSRSWSMDSLTGQLLELEPSRSSAQLTAAFGLVLDAQKQGEATAWITTVHSSFFPPDVAEGGVDLDALVVVRLSCQDEIYKAADKLLRSGAFGLVILDLNSMRPNGQRTSHGYAWDGVQARLAGLARKHSTAVVLLKSSQDKGKNTSPMISMHASAHRFGSRAQTNPAKGFTKADYSMQIQITRDKTGTLEKNHKEQCRGPAGLR